MLLRPVPQMMQPQLPVPQMMQPQLPVPLTRRLLLPQALLALRICRLQRWPCTPPHG